MYCTELHYTPQGLVFNMIIMKPLEFCDERSIAKGWNHILFACVVENSETFADACMLDPYNTLCVGQ